MLSASSIAVLVMEGALVYSSGLCQVCCCTHRFSGGVYLPICSLRELLTTQRELSAMQAAAMAGLRVKPVRG